MASLRQISDRCWEVRWRDPRSGSQPRRRYPNQETAYRAYAEAMTLEGLDPRTPIERRMSVGDLVAEEAVDSGRLQSTAKTRTSYIGNHVPNWMMDRDAHLVGIEDIEDVLAAAGERLCRESVKKLRSILHSSRSLNSPRQLRPGNGT